MKSRLAEWEEAICVEAIVNNQMTKGGFNVPGRQFCCF
jgi:hypothetical protein